MAKQSKIQTVKISAELARKHNDVSCSQAYSYNRQWYLDVQIQRNQRFTQEDYDALVKSIEQNYLDFSNETIQME